MRRPEIEFTFISDLFHFLRQIF